MKTFSVSSALLFLSHPSSCYLLLIVPSSQQCPPLPSNVVSFSSFAYSKSPKFSFRLRAKYRQWDSNAESLRNHKFNLDSKPIFPSDSDDDDEEEGDNGSSFSTDLVIDLWKEFLDGVWILKVFRSYGWMIPAIIISMLLATGPKAFLMALALPVGQSALSLAFKRLSGRTKRKVKFQTKTKKKSRGHNSYKFELADEEEEENQGTKNGKTGYRSWVVENGAPGVQGGDQGSRFGGWDDLDVVTKSNSEYWRRSAQTADAPQKTATMKSTSSMGKIKREMPLLLRLLIAAFPFLSSWTKML